MRLINYINESEDIPWDKIKKDCQPFIKDIKSPNDFLYSGRQTNEKFFTRKVRKNRVPTDTPEIIHNLLDDMFKKKFGHKLRSESLFVTKDVEIASGYGTPYIILPIGNYKLFGNPKIYDLYSYINGNFDLEEMIDFWTTEYIKPAKKEFIDNLQKVINKYKELQASKIGDYEVMLLTNEYYGIRIKNTEDDFTTIFNQLKG